MEVRDVLIPICVIALIAFMGVFAFEHWPQDVPEQQEQSYELYQCIPLSNFGEDPQVSGAGEVVEIGGEPYVRMTSIGTLVADDRAYAVGPARLDLVVLSGQSNSVFYTSPSYYPGPSPVAPGTAFVLGNPDLASGTLAGLMTPETVDMCGLMDFVDDQGGVRVSQMYPAFLHAYVQETGHRVLVVNTGIGGQGIASWDRGEQCDLWMTQALEKAKEIEEGGTVELSPTVVLWAQGETDRFRTQEYYEEKLEDLIGRLTGDYYPYSFPQMTSVIPRFAGHGPDDMITSALAQIAVAETVPSFTVATVLPPRLPSDLYRDSVHWQQAPYGWFGEALGRQYAIDNGLGTVAETIVYCEDLGEVSELPYMLTAYGTSGEGYEILVNWIETDEPGVYKANWLGNPIGCKLYEGLSCTATLVQEDEEDEEESE